MNRLDTLRTALVYPRGDALEALTAALLATAYGWRGWERDLRAWNAIRQAGLESADLRAMLAIRSDWPLAIHAAISMQRDGYLREATLRVLDRHPGRLALAALLNRIADPVPAIAAFAMDALARRLNTVAADDLIWALPLIDALARTVRGAASRLAVLVNARLQTPEMRGALHTAWHAPDARLRRSALGRSAQLARSADAHAAVLACALRDSSPVIRNWAADQVFERCAPPHLGRLLDVISTHGGPRARLMAVRVRRRQGDAAAVEQACFDHNANVRFYARRYARALSQKMNFHARAWAILDRPESPLRQQIGALAVLSEFGAQEDRARLQPWVCSRNARIAAEARRTLSLLPD
jgi:hypothetical protein